ncbi:MAG: PQQ-binding-like beta-propeller repeat protein [Acidobacteria bacterium]|nr:PQQ-binding-like beta-propeller repeat protein [Acidobacteriota bacterium]
MQTTRAWTRLAVMAAALGGSPQPAVGQTSLEAGAWPSYGGTNWSQKYSPLDQIDADNFDDLTIAWTWQSEDVALIESLQRRYLPPLDASGLKATPLVVNGVMYLSTGLAQVVALDPVTGETLWVHNPQAYTTGGNASIVGPWQTRGLAYWTDGADDERLLLGTHDGFLIAVNARTGRPINSFGVDGKSDLHTAVPRATRGNLPLFSNEGHTVSPNSPPVVVRDTVISGSAMSDRPTLKEWPPGSVQGFDVRTGDLKWIFHTIPQAGAFGEDTWENGSNLYTGHANVWSTLSGDDELGHVYLATTAPTSDYWGGERLGDNLFSQSIVAVDVETGERVWHFQAIHHCVWDWDFPTAPTLMNITVDGRDVRALAQVSKQGFTYVLDRATGEPVWPIEERPVPPSDVPGEVLSPTQPHPTKPPAFEYQGVTEDLLIDFTPELRAEAVEILKQYAHGGMFTPQTLYDHNGTHGTLQVPGSGGGANWGGSGADPETGFLYVPSESGLTRMVLVEGKPSFTNLRYVPNGKLGPESVHPDRPPAVTGPQGLPLIKPPYSRLTAYDMNRGEIAWQTPTGVGSDRIRNHPALAGLDLPPLGGQNTTSGPLITKTLVMLGLGPAGATDSSALVAYDKATGTPLAQVALPSRPLGTPMTYAIDGRQFIVLTLQGAQMVALALPAAP